jgi:L-threonylcarbamoyladenylate synthase
MTKSLKSIKRLSPADIKAIVELLEAGEALVYPTETCYGLGCLVTKPEAIERVFKIKGRPQEKTFPILFPSIAVLNEYVSIKSPRFVPLTAKFWPGPLTLVLPATAKGSAIFPSHPQTLAVRISPHPFLVELFKRISTPLISTSANLTGEPPVETADQASQTFSGSDLGAIIDGGPLSATHSSTILDLSSAPPRVLREGLVSHNELRPFFA